MITPFTIKPEDRTWEHDYWAKRLTDEYINSTEGQNSSSLQRVIEQRDALLAREAWEKEHNLNSDGTAINAFWSDRFFRKNGESVTVPPEEPVSAEQLAFEATLPEWVKDRYYRISIHNKPERGLIEVRQFDSQDEWDVYLAEHCDLDAEYCMFIQPIHLGTTTVTGGFARLHHDSYPYTNYKYRVTLNSYKELKAYASYEDNEDGCRDTETTFLWWQDETGKRERLIDYKSVLAQYQ